MASESPGTSDDQALKIVLIGVCFEAGLGVVAAILGRLVGISVVRDLSWDVWALAWGVLATIPLLAFFLLMLYWPIEPLRKIRAILDAHLLPMLAPCATSDLAAISIAAGLGEEVFFRGLIQAGLIDTVGAWPAVLIASLAFGLVHFITPTYVLLAGLIGVYLGWLQLVTGNLLAPIVAHALYDFLALLYMLKLQRPPTAVEEPAGAPEDAPPD